MAEDEYPPLIEMADAMRDAIFRAVQEAPAPDAYYGPGSWWAQALDAADEYQQWRDGK